MAEPLGTSAPSASSSSASAAAAPASSSAPNPSQWAWRSQQAVGLHSGAPHYANLRVEGIQDESTLKQTARALAYSPDGSLLAAAFEDGVRLIRTGDAEANDVSANAPAPPPSPPSLHHLLPIPRVVDLSFSPRGSFLSTWQRPFKLDDGVTGARNLNVWDTATAKNLGSFERRSQEGCHFQFTHNELYALRLVSSELQVYDAKELAAKGVIGRLRLEGMTSYEVGPGEKPSVAIFCGEKKGAPASVKVYPLASLLTPEPQPIAQKTFFKADKIQIKWNTPGTAILFLTSTEHDRTNKSYYGETNLYMMSTRGDFDCRVALDKDGPIHDFEWNPNGREFIVIYGYMPAKTTLFSYKVNVIAELGTSGRNFAAFNPQGRLLALGGFGNLRGEVDIWDRTKLGGQATDPASCAAAKLATFDASNSSVCQWSPDGQFLLTATLSPRLRVENGVKVWHCSGKLVHLDFIHELYHASWRPMLASDAMARYPFPSSLPSPPPPSESAAQHLAAAAAKAASKPAGAYRPPGARGQPASDIFARRFEEAMAATSSAGGASASASGSSTPTGTSANGGAAYLPPGAQGRRGAKVVPGAAKPGANATPTAAANSSKARTKKSAKATNDAGDDLAAAGAAAAAAAAATPRSGPVDVGGASAATTNGADAHGANANDGDGGGGAENTGSGGGASSSVDKKLRNINKKLKAIQELKERRERGETLEKTQLQKIEAEAELRRELANLE